MWQKSGSEEKISYRIAKKYVEQLNSKNFNGYSDWRLPTVEELASLLQNHERHDSPFNRSFSPIQQQCWSSDRANSYADNDQPTVWIVNFDDGIFKKAAWWDGFNRAPQFLGSEPKHEKNYVRAVRGSIVQ